MNAKKMDKKIQNITAQFHKLKNNNQFVVFIICLLIASSLWFLNALSKDYTATVYYPVKYTNPPKKLLLVNQPPERLELNVEAHGFTLLRHKLNIAFSPIVLNLSSLIKNLPSGNGTYTVSTRNLVDKISDQISKEINVINVHPEYLEFQFDSLISKMVPVKPHVQTVFMPRYNLKSPVATIPGMVKVTGPSNIIDTLEFVLTRFKTFSKIEHSFEKNIDLIVPENLSVSPDHVLIKVEVDTYTEKELTIPLKVRNQPENSFVKLFPSEIKIIISVGLSEFDKIGPADFEASVDFATASKESETLKVIIDKQPELNQVIRFVPERVEYLIETIN